MDPKDKKPVKSRSQVLISMTVGICSILFMIFLYMILGDGDMHGDFVVQDQLFDVTVGEASYPQTDLATLTFPRAKRGDTIRYSTVLKGHVPMPVLRIYVIHSLVKVYLDEECIFTHGDPDAHLLGYGYVMIPLPEDCEGHRLTVEQQVGESNEIGNIRNPILYNSNQYFLDQLKSNRLVLFTDTAIVMMALAIIIVGFIFIRRIPEAKNLMWMAAAFLGMSLWEFCNSNLILLFSSNNLSLKGYMEYLSLYITPIFLLMYFADDLYHKENRKDQAAFLTILGIQLTFIVTTLSLHFSDVVHLPGVLYCGHFVIILTLAYILAMNLRQVFRREAAHNEILMGTLILALVGLSDIIRYLLFKLLLKNNSDYTSFILIGMYAFALCMILDFFNTQQRNVISEAKSEALEKLAYSDIMTGLYNRRKINEVVEEVVEEKGSRRFGIVNFDLNELKKANDEYGHTAGDQLLADFSALLTETFGEKAVVARMGGDEFIAFYRDTENVDHDALLRRLEELCEEENKEREGVKISFASGFSSVTEEELAQLKSQPPEKRKKIIRSVYQRADDLMYANKAEIKRKRDQ